MYFLPQGAGATPEPSTAKETMTEAPTGQASGGPAASAPQQPIPMGWTDLAPEAGE